MKDSMEFKTNTATLAELQAAESKLLLQTYARNPLQLVRGEGVHLYDENNVAYLDLLSGIGVCALGYNHPVISSIALGFDGEYYNINADEMASAAAIATKADALVFLTDVPGVKGADGNVLRWLSLKEIPALEAAAVVSGGMLPKLNACKVALTGGVKRVRILPAESATLLPDLISSRVNDGTEVIAA